ncbi:MAG TPA: hypothetical protein VLT47_14225 [Anaeromyxobacteraceae bacterium]|nr:hypothetical protein [Anaeromyxobacteraceae bacterium]
MGYFHDILTGRRPWRVPGTTIPIIPPRFLGENASKLLGAVGTVFDARAAQIRDGRAAAIPYAGWPGSPERACWADGTPIECEPNALPIHSTDRGIKLYATEPLLSQRIRLANWRQLHAQRGTAFGEIEHVRPYFADFAAAGGAYPTIRIVFQDNAGTPGATWHTIDPAGVRSVHTQRPSNWIWDAHPELRTRWWAIIHLPPGWTTYSATLWDSGALWDSGFLWDGIPAAVLADLWSMFYDWKGAHSWFGGLIVTALQPTDDLPEFPGTHPFDPASSNTTNANGSTNLPTFNWWTDRYLSGPLLGDPTRPYWATFYNMSNSY